MRVWPFATSNKKRHKSGPGVATNGATAVEYALIAGGIALAIVVALSLAGGSVGDFYDSMASALGGG